MTRVWKVWEFDDNGQQIICRRGIGKQRRRKKKKKGLENKGKNTNRYWKTKKKKKQDWKTKKTITKKHTHGGQMVVDEKEM